MYQRVLKKDLVLKLILKKPVALSIRKNLCLQLCLSIISQQLSNKVAKIICTRFLDLIGKKNPSPSDILSFSFDTLKAVGLSSSKTTYIQNVCRFFVEEKLNDRKLHAMNDEDVIACLTQIKGVGQWTVEMLLMFAMGREDVFAADDLGIQKRMIDLYDIRYEHKKELKEKMIAIAENWRPYRSYACRYCWGV